MYLYYPIKMSLNLHNYIITSCPFLSTIVKLYKRKCVVCYYNYQQGGDTMIKTYNELYKFVKESDNFGKDVLDILFELDETGSIVTQASLNDILVSIYNRLDKCKIRIEGLGEKVSKSEFAQWVEDKFDTYTANLFKDSI